MDYKCLKTGYYKK